MKQKAIFLVLVAMATGWGHPCANAIVPTNERNALVDFYNGTGGAAWTDNSGWMGAQGTECSWYGITCDTDETHVTQIILSDNHLTGSVPSSIGNLTDLTYLAIFLNDGLTGTIPDSLGNLSKLENLTLNLNGLTGTIPATLGNLTNLRYLYLNNNQLTGGIPAELGSLTNLLYLYLSDNQLTGVIPASLGNLSKLLQLDMNNNKITGPIPANLGSLSKLQKLLVRNNLLRGEIPDALSNLTGLLNNNSDFRDNALYTENTTLRDFLNAKQINGDWESFQSSPMDLAGAITVLRALAGLESVGIQRITDVDQDGYIGLAETVYMLQNESGLRQ